MADNFTTNDLGKVLTLLLKCLENLFDTEFA